jgi:3-phosphoshikimate 1-carboxyvinyltransferase
MKALISKSEIRGITSAPSSKSYTIRGLICGALANGTSRILQPLGSDDTKAAFNVLKNLGIKTRKAKSAWTVTSLGLKAPTADLYCRDSATTFRFMTAICAIVPGTCRLTAGPSLSRRPQKVLLESLKQLGVKCSGNGDFPPVIVEGGKLRGGITNLPGDISSQFVSAILLAAPFTENPITVKVTTPMESRPYVMMTMDTMQQFGISVTCSEKFDEFKIEPQRYRPTAYKIEGDWSSASYLLALGAMNGEIEIDNLPSETMQGDRMILDFLQEMGAKTLVRKNSVIIWKSNLKAIKANLSDCIDLLPTMAVLAAVADGTSHLTGLARARIKESDRVSAMAQGLYQMGIKVTEENDRLIITGGSPKVAAIDSKNDHRIAMAFSLLGTIAGDTIIEQAESVAKTYPEFWDVLENLGGKVTLED